MKARTKVVRTWRTDYLNNIKKVEKSIRRNEYGRVGQGKEVG